MSIPRAVLTGMPALLLAMVLSATGSAAADLGNNPAHPAFGTPLMRRFGPEDYVAAPTHLDVVADDRGRMLIGNIEGILRYDGEDWELIGLPGKMPARALARGEDNRIYVGGYDSFGWLDSDELGRPRYRELLTAVGLRDEQRHIGTVWEVIATPEGVYFRSEHHLHFLDYRHQSATTWPLSDAARGFYAAGNRLYSRFQGLGFGRVAEGGFTLEPGGEVLADTPLAAVLSGDGEHLLVAEDGFYRATEKGVQRIATADREALAQSQPYTATRLIDGSIAVGTRNGEVLHFDAELRLRQRIPVSAHAVSAMARDHEGGLWVATGGGLIRIELPSPWSFLGSAQGLPGTVYDFEWFEGALWLAGSHGVSRLAPQGLQSRVEPKDWVALEAFALHASDDALLIAHRDGILQLARGARLPRELLADDAQTVYSLMPSRHRDDLVFAIADTRLHLLRRFPSGWRVSESLSLEGLSPFGVEEGAPGELWLGDSRGGPRRWTLDLEEGRRLSETIFDAAQGLEIDPDSGCGVFRLDDTIHVTSGERGFRYDGARFVPDVAPPFTLVDRPDELVVTDTPLGTYAYTSRQLWHRATDATQWQPLYLNPDLAAGYSNLRVNRDGNLRIATWGGLLQFDPQQPMPAPNPITLRIERAIARAVDGSRPPFALPTNSPMPATVPPGHTLSLWFSLVSMESGAQYRYHLHGVTPDWSNWADRDLTIRALPAGDYVLDVQGRTRSGREAPGLSFRFRVQPYWYEQWWAWLLGLLVLVAAGGLLTLALVRRRTERYQRANRRLEAHIAERTRELEDANRQLAELATEDALTRIANRRALEQGLRREWLRCLDQRRTLSALMIDVDHFKQYNDRHGHLEGDAMLRAVAQHLRERHDPQRELLARYGGEEFALLLPGVPLDQALRRAEAVRTDLAASELGVTVSIGVAGMVPNVQAEPENLLRRADAALYRAKRGGRNRVEADAD